MSIKERYQGKIEQVPRHQFLLPARTYSPARKVICTCIKYFSLVRGQILGETRFGVE